MPRAEGDSAGGLPPGRHPGGMRTIRPDAPLPLDALPVQEGEEWRYWPPDDTYAISSHGRAARMRAGGPSYAGDLLSLRPRASGVEVYVGGRYQQVPRLMLETFVGPPPDPAMRAHHLDLDHLHNRLDNLAWALRTKILTDDYGAGRSRRPKGTRFGAWTGEIVTDAARRSALRTRIAAACARTGMTLSGLAVALAVPQPTLSGWASGVRVPLAKRYAVVMERLDAIEREHAP